LWLVVGANQVHSSEAVTIEFFYAALCIEDVFIDDIGTTSRSGCVAKSDLSNRAEFAEEIVQLLASDVIR